METLQIIILQSRAERLGIFNNDAEQKDTKEDQNDQPLTTA